MGDFREVLYEQYVSSFKDKDGIAPSGPTPSYRRWCSARLLPFLSDLPSSASILELGCGPGHFVEILRDAGFSDASGVDVSAEQVEVAKSRDLNVGLGDARTALRESPGKHDAIVALDFIEHFSKDELLQIAQEVANALKPGGRLLIQTPNGEGLSPGGVMYGDLTHLTILTPGSFMQLFSLVGMSTFQFSETAVAANSFKGLLRASAWWAIKKVANAVRRIEAGKRQALWSENMICSCKKPAAS